VQSPPYFLEETGSFLNKRLVIRAPILVQAPLLLLFI
jgi:hypothetical protein